MIREELILDCRYYNGENEPPEGTDSLMWGYEEAWVRFALNNDPILQKHVEYYSREHDLPNLLPESADGTPIGLKAILWSRYDYWGNHFFEPKEEQGKRFKEWYLREYVANTKTHRQLLNQ